MTYKILNFDYELKELMERLKYEMERDLKEYS